MRPSPGAPHGDTCPRCAELEREVAHLRRGLAAHALVGQATGILMATRKWSAEEAFQTLVTVSQHRNRKLRDIAAELVATCGAQPVASSRDTGELRRSELIVRLDADRDGIILTLDGDLDVTTAAQLEQVLAAAPPGPLRVDLRDLGFADLRGFAPLLQAARIGRQVRLEHTPRFARRLLEMVSLPESLVLDERLRESHAEPL